MADATASPRRVSALAAVAAAATAASTVAFVAPRSSAPAPLRPGSSLQVDSITPRRSLRTPAADSAASGLPKCVPAVGLSCLGAAALAARRRSKAQAVPATKRYASSMRSNEGDGSAATAGDALKEGKGLKVAIAGGGVGGLTTALAMLKEGWDVTVYERTGQFARFGGPIQFASNALSTLKAIDERLFERVMSKFQFTGTRRCGIKDGLRADGSFRMTNVVDPSYLWDSSVPADWFVEFPLKACADFFKLPYTGVINRPDLQDILIDECRRIKPDFIRNGSPVVGYENHDSGVTVKLESGETVEADVLVGSDGIWSAVRAQMYDEGPIKQKSPDGSSIQKCRYSGYTVFAGETTMKLGDYYECGYKVYIGPGRYFVTSDVGDGRIQWYAFLALPPGTKKAGDTWDGSGTSKSEGSDVISYLKGLHEGWTDEVFQVLNATPPESVEQRDLYDRLPEFFRSWAEDSTVLIGDAVHPMMPNLGQGGCQAIEDAYELTKSLKSVTLYSQEGAPPESLRKVLQDFYWKRMPRVAGVSLLSGLASDLIINAFDTPWSPHDDKGTDWKSYLTFAWKPILQYIVFPAQFLFLYSYHPSGSMGDLPKRLVSEWEVRHRKTAEEAFERVARDGQQVGGPSFFAKVEEMAAAAVSGERKK